MEKDISEEIEHVLWANCTVFESNYETEGQNIISKETVLYTNGRRDGIVGEFINNNTHLNVNKNLRDKIDCDLSVRLENFIQQSPPIKWNIVLWRVCRVRWT